MIEIVKKHKDYIIIYKPPGIPTQPDPTGDPDAMALTRDALSALGERTDLWLVHRLDRVVGGLIVFARSRSAAAVLSAAAAGDDMTKEYLAVAEGSLSEGEYRDLLFKDAAKGKAFVVQRERKGVKQAVLICRPLSEANGRTLASVKLLTGRFHQIRAQLSHRGAPLVGDGKYGSRDKGARMPALFAYRLSFAWRDERVVAERLPSADEYPWSLFDFKIINGV